MNRRSFVKSAVAVGALALIPLSGSVAKTKPSLVWGVEVFNKGKWTKVPTVFSLKEGDIFRVRYPKDAGLFGAGGGGVVHRNGHEEIFTKGGWFEAGHEDIRTWSCQVRDDGVWKVSLTPKGVCVQLTDRSRHTGWSETSVICKPLSPEAFAQLS